MLIKKKENLISVNFQSVLKRKFVAMQSKENALSNLKTFRVELTDAMRHETFREGVLIRGDFGWSEFAPFLITQLNTVPGGYKLH